MRKTHTRNCACESCIATYEKYLALQSITPKRAGYKKPSRYLTHCANCKKLFYVHPQKVLTYCSGRCHKELMFGATETTKTCKKCGLVKDRSEFWRSGNGEYYSRCKKCAKQDQTEFCAKHPELRSQYHRVSCIRRMYNLEPEQYFEMLQQQGGVCAICGTDKPNARTKNFFVDHCHGTNAVRGLLCGRCNTGLGHFKDDPEVLAKASEYLKPRPEKFKIAS